MCGLFGWDFSVNRGRNGIGRRQRAVLAASLMTANLARGKDSWGLFDLLAGERVVGIGEIIDGIPATALSERELVLCHTRAATSGAITVENCHPFDIGALVGAHNGIVTNHGELNKKYGRGFAVDSQHVFAHIAESLPLEEIQGYGAITYTRRDSDTRRIKLCRWNSGELSVWKVAGGVIWSSARSAIERALKQAGIYSRKDVVPYSVDADSLYYVEGGTLYKTELTFKFGERGVRTWTRDWHDDTEWSRGYGCGFQGNSAATVDSDEYRRRYFGGDDAAPNANSLMPKAGDIQEAQRDIEAHDSDFGAIERWFLLEYIEDEIEKGAPVPSCTRGAYRYVRVPSRDGSTEQAQRLPVGQRLSHEQARTRGVLMASWVQDKSSRTGGTWYWRASGKYKWVPLDEWGVMLSALPKLDDVEEDSPRGRDNVMLLPGPVAGSDEE